MDNHSFSSLSDSTFSLSPRLVLEKFDRERENRKISDEDSMLDDETSFVDWRESSSEFLLKKNEQESDLKSEPFKLPLLEQLSPRNVGSPMSLFAQLKKGDFDVIEELLDEGIGYLSLQRKEEKEIVSPEETDASTAHGGSRNIAHYESNEGVHSSAEVPVLNKNVNASAALIPPVFEGESLELKNCYLQSKISQQQHEIFKLQGQLNQITQQFNTLKRQETVLKSQVDFAANQLESWMSGSTVKSVERSGTRIYPLLLQQLGYAYACQLLHAENGILREKQEKQGAAQKASMLQTERKKGKIRVVVRVNTHLLSLGSNSSLLGGTTKDIPPLVSAEKNENSNFPKKVDNIKKENKMAHTVHSTSDVNLGSPCSSSDYSFSVEELRSSCLLQIDAERQSLSLWNPSAHLTHFSALAYRVLADPNLLVIDPKEIQHLFAALSETKHILPDGCKLDRKSTVKEAGGESSSLLRPKDEEIRSNCPPVSTRASKIFRDEEHHANKMMGLTPLRENSSNFDLEALPKQLLAATFPSSVPGSVYNSTDTLFLSDILPLLNIVLDGGEDASCIALGQGGSGKTYSLFGSPTTSLGAPPASRDKVKSKRAEGIQVGSAESPRSSKAIGIVERSLDYLFRRLDAELEQESFLLYLDSLWRTADSTMLPLLENPYHHVFPLSDSPEGEGSQSSPLASRPTPSVASPLPSYEVSITMCELYMNKVLDLLGEPQPEVIVKEEWNSKCELGSSTDIFSRSACSTSSGADRTRYVNPPCEIKANSNGEAEISSIHRVSVSCVDEAMSWITKGLQRRTTRTEGCTFSCSASTESLQAVASPSEFASQEWGRYQRSRSHVILQIHVLTRHSRLCPLPKILHEASPARTRADSSAAHVKNPHPLGSIGHCSHTDPLKRLPETVDAVEGSSPQCRKTASDPLDIVHQYLYESYRQLWAPLSEEEKVEKVHGRSQPKKNESSSEASSSLSYRSRLRVTTRERKLVFVDLAGSERLSSTTRKGARGVETADGSGSMFEPIPHKKAGAALLINDEAEGLLRLGDSQLYLQEAQFISRSTSALYDVLAALGQRVQAHAPVGEKLGKPSEGHIPFRSTKLTALLQGVLSRGAACVVLAHIVAKPVPFVAQQLFSPLMSPLGGFCKGKQEKSDECLTHVRSFSGCGGTEKKSFFPSAVEKHSYHLSGTGSTKPFNHVTDIRGGSGFNASANTVQQQWENALRSCYLQQQEEIARSHTSSHGEVCEKPLISGKSRSIERESHEGEKKMVTTGQQRSQTRQKERERALSHYMGDSRRKKSHFFGCTALSTFVTPKETLSTLSWIQRIPQPIQACLSDNI